LTISIKLCPATSCTAISRVKKSKWEEALHFSKANSQITIYQFNSQITIYQFELRTPLGSSDVSMS